MSQISHKSPTAAGQDVDGVGGDTFDMRTLLLPMLFVLHHFQRVCIVPPYRGCSCAAAEKATAFSGLAWEDLTAERDGVQPRPLR